MNSNFDIKNIGQTDVTWGIQIKRNSNGYILTQFYYVKKILKRFDQLDCYPPVITFDANCKLKKNTGDIISQLEYSQIMGSLMYFRAIKWANPNGFESNGSGQKNSNLNGSRKL